VNKILDSKTFKSLFVPHAPVLTDELKQQIIDETQSAKEEAEDEAQSEILEGLPPSLPEEDDGSIEPDKRLVQEIKDDGLEHQEEEEKEQKHDAMPLQVEDNLDLVSEESDQ